MSGELTLNNHEMDEGLIRTFKNKIDALLEVCPSDAGASSNITKTKTGYLGAIQIFSSQGRFMVEASGHTLNIMIKSLFRLMYRQMKVWRNRRFMAGTQGMN